MKWALLSDIHSNLQALEACEAHARSQGVQRWAVLGDLVGYGADPCAVVDRVMGWHAEGACVLQGNHDAMAVSPPATEPGAQSMGTLTAAWTHDQLRAEQRDFLASLPLTQRLEHVLLVHASAHQPQHWRYVQDERTAQQCLNAAAQDFQCSQVFVGHVHQQTLFYQGSGRGMMPFAPTPGVPVPLPRHRSWVATIGSVGQPRDGDPRAMYAIYDDTTAKLAFQRVPYDHEGAAAAIRHAGLPDFLASRLGEGR